MQVIQSPSFARRVKKFHKDQKKSLDSHIKKILKDPKIGDGKKGDLQGVFVYKFKFKTQQFLLAYRINKNTIKGMIQKHLEEKKDSEK